MTSDRREAREAIAAFSGRRGDYEPHNEYEREFMASTPAAIDQARMQITLSAVQALAVHLGWVSADARKSLLVVTSEMSRAQRRRGLALPTVESISSRGEPVQRRGVPDRPRWPSAAVERGGGA